MFTLAPQLFWSSPHSILCHSLNLTKANLCWPIFLDVWPFTKAWSTSQRLYTLWALHLLAVVKNSHTPPHVCLNICTCTTCMPGLTKAKIRHWIPWNWDYRWLWVLGTKSEVLEPLSHLTSHDQSLGPLLVISKEVEYISVQTHNVTSN